MNGYQLNDSIDQHGQPQLNSTEVHSGQRQLWFASLLLISVTLGATPRSMANAPDTAQTQPESSDSTNESDPEVKATEGKWGRFLPLPIFITEPAIGEGLGASLIYFHHDDAADKPRLSTGRGISKTGERSKPPPVATGIFGFYTNNDTAAVGIGHSNTFADDRYRLRAGVVDARINSDFYIGDRPVGFQLDGNLLFADLKSRLGDSGAFFGISMSYVNAANTFREAEDEIDGISLLDFDFVDAGLAASLIYDTRDNTVMPVAGYLLELTGWRYGETLSGDFDYDTTRLRGLWFKELGQDYVVGVRIDATRASGDVPFYAAPFVRLRGIPALRYQGEMASAFELEGRRHFGDRWSGSLFAGVGSVSVGEEQTETRDDIRTIGIGTRFLALRKQDAWIGIDVARGPEEIALYIQFGSAW